MKISLVVKSYCEVYLVKHPTGKVCNTFKYCDVLEPVLACHPSTKPLFINKHISTHGGDVGGSKLSFLDFLKSQPRYLKMLIIRLGEHRRS
jgi:hypothetical protein